MFQNIKCLRTINTSSYSPGVPRKFILFTGCPISYRKCILQITHPSQYKYTKLQHRFAVISEAPSILHLKLLLYVQEVMTHFI